MWKTIKLEVGEEMELDAPNEKATVRVVPLSWLPGKINQEIMSASQADEDKIAALPPNDNATMMNIRMETLYSTLPHIIASWDLKDPDTGEPLDTPRAMQTKGDVSALRMLPMQLLSHIFNKAMEYGMEELDAQPPAEQQDPDAGNEAAQVIPFENANVSERPSFQEAALLT